MDFLKNLFDLSGKTAVVCGGAGAIGTVMSDALLRAGANVVVWSRTQTSIDLFFDRYKDEPECLDRLHGIAVDTADESAVSAGIETVTARYSLPEILVNCVGGNKGKSAFIDIDIKQFREILEMNLSAGLVIPTKLFCRHWIHHHVKGSIINLSSMTAYNPLSGVWAYDAAKAAVLNLTKATANEFAAHGIRVNAIAPGFFVGKQNKDLLIDPKTGAYTKRGKAIVDRTPFKRFGNVEELAGATVFLASPKASGFVTGISLPVDGGFLVHNI